MNTQQKDIIYAIITAKSPELGDYRKILSDAANCSESTVRTILMERNSPNPRYHENRRAKVWDAAYKLAIERTELISKLNLCD